MSNGVSHVAVAGHWVSSKQRVAVREIWSAGCKTQIARYLIHGPIF